MFFDTADEENNWLPAGKSRATVDGLVLSLLTLVTQQDLVADARLIHL